MAKGNTSYTSYHISSSILLQDDSYLQMSDSNVGDEMEDFTGLLFCLFSFTLKIFYQKSYIFLSLFLSLTQISPVLSQYSNQPLIFTANQWAGVYIMTILATMHYKTNGNPDGFRRSDEGASLSQWTYNLN